MSSLLYLAVGFNSQMFEKVNPLMETSQTMQSALLPYVVNRPLKRPSNRSGTPFGGRLHHALGLTHINRLRQLLYAGADTRQLDDRGVTILKRVIVMNFLHPDQELMLNRLRLILEVDPFILEEQDVFGLTALHHTLNMRIYLDMGVPFFKLLVDACPHALLLKNIWGYTPLNMIKEQSEKWPHIHHLFQTAAASL